MSKNITAIAAEWEEISAEVEAEGGDRAAAWAAFEHEHDLFDVSAPHTYYGEPVQETLEGYFGLVDTDDGDESIGESGERFLKSLPNAEMNGGVYAVMDYDALLAHTWRVLYERLEGDYYDCNDACPAYRDGGCDHASARYDAARAVA